MSNDSKLAKSARLERHRRAQAELTALSDAELADWLGASGPVPGQHGLRRLPVSSSEVFVKWVPVTALELDEHWRGSTWNFFRLPALYQYRMGGLGFGVWRELEVHQLANEWVRSGRAQGFPLLHHWRVVAAKTSRVDEWLVGWGEVESIQHRAHAVEASTASVVLIMEGFAQTLGGQLRERLPQERSRMPNVLQLERELLGLLAFMAGQGVQHMDAHLENVLTDGHSLFLADFGLAASLSFALGDEALRFFDRHVSFDRATAVTGLVHAVISHFDTREDWRAALRERLAVPPGSAQALPADVHAYLVARAPIALAMGEFYRQLRADLSAEYPDAQLRALLDAALSESR